ncbi:GntR family transcriptional regulator [Mycetocola zhadangensis]|uniref:GntR family transcriptional regulator n=1 Tax=Mycetocola zhadangensis TaxID=1164595 RepID=A0A3L7J258_9MICO|nr:GntR family transcriptional regulator [Mycetocola zhadangensis]RLQ84678.1 GntR family transcriptional regulator [Mycetocola zhadangensis]
MFTGEIPIYQQLADRVAEDILAGTYPEESSVPSTNEYAVFYQISPITAAKGVNLLVEQGVLYKKRGVGMFVAAGAREKLRVKRRAAFSERHIAPLVHEARLLRIYREELDDLINQEDSK